MNVQLYDENKNLFVSLYSEGGYGTAATDMYLLMIDSDGKYKVFSPDREWMTTEIENSVDIKINVTEKTALFSSHGNECTVNIDGYGENTLKETDIYCSGKSKIDYVLRNGKILCRVPFSYMMTDFVYAETEVNFNNGEFTIGQIELNALI